MRRIINLLFFSILFILSLVVASGCSRTEKSEMQNNNSLSEIEIYAKLDGITVEEELRRLEIQNAFAGLDTQLSIEEPETFRDSIFRVNQSSAL